MAGSRRNEIIIALIGLIGVAVSNWDKIFPSAANNPVPSGDINVQARYYVESAGLRTGLEAIEKARAERYRREFKLSSETVDCMIDMDIPTTQLVEIATNVLKAHFTVDELKELNRIEATPLMRRVAEKQPAIALDLVKGIEDAAERARRRNLAIAGGERKVVQRDSACPAQ